MRIPSARPPLREFPYQYSGGMLQRAMIVDALVTKPAIIIADNITQPLDVTVAAQIVRLLRDLRDSIEADIVFIANSLPAVRELADDVVVLSGGRLVERGTPDELAHNPRDAYTRQLVDRIRPHLERRPGRRVERRRRPASRSCTRARTSPRPTAFRDRNTLLRHAGGAGGARRQLRRACAVRIFGLIGESGCGKSTLSRLLSWIEQPDKRHDRFEGRTSPRWAAPRCQAMRHRFQLLLQDPYNSIPPHLTVGRTIEEPLRVHEQDRAREIGGQRVRAVMDEVGLPVADYERCRWASAPASGSASISRGLLRSSRGC